MKRSIIKPKFAKVPLLFLFLCVCSSFSLSADEGRIVGTIANMTQNEWVTNADVTLSVLKSGTIVSTKKSKSDKGGSFSFSNLEVSEEVSYVVSAVYQEVEYSQTVRLSAETSEQNIALNVFEKSSDGSKVKVNAHHIVVEPSSGEFIDIMEFVLLENSSLTSYIGEESMPITTPHGNKVGSKIILPKGYESLEFIDGISESSSYVKKNLVLDSHAVKPGETPIIYRYKLKLGGSLDLSRNLIYHTERLMLMIANSSWQPDSASFQRGEDASFHGRTYATYTMNDLGKSGSLEVKLIRSGGSAQSVGEHSDWGAWLMPVMIAIVSAGAGVSFSLAVVSKRKKGGRAEKKSEKIDSALGSWASLLSRSELEKLKEVHLEFIARLDELGEANKIPENVYQGLRAEEKKKLAAVMMKLEKYAA